jgi:hypothetical protein
VENQDEDTEKNQKKIQKENKCIKDIKKQKNKIIRFFSEYFAPLFIKVKEWI